MKTSNHSAKHSDDGGKSVSARSFRPCPRSEPGQPVSKRQVLLILSPRPLQAYKLIEQFTPLKLPISEVFNTIKDQPWVRRSRPIQYDPSHPGAEEYYFYHDGKGHKTIHYQILRRYLEELIRLGFLKEYVLTPEAIFGAGQPNAPPPTQSHHAITQCKAIRSYLLKHGGTPIHDLPITFIFVSL